MCQSFWVLIVFLTLTSYVGLLVWVSHINYRQGKADGEIEASRSFNHYRDLVQEEYKAISGRLTELEYENGELKLRLKAGQHS